jgi:hypothetical protein
MLYKFKSKAGADVIMLAAQGEQLLRLIGRTPSAQGIIEAAALGAAVSALEQAVADDEATFAQAQAEAAAAGETAPRREGVSLRARMWPMVELMRRSASANVDVVWGV